MKEGCECADVVHVRNLFLVQETHFHILFRIYESVHVVYFPVLSDVRV